MFVSVMLSGITEKWPSPICIVSDGGYGVLGLRR